jgi:four helix bundle protein
MGSRRFEDVRLWQKAHGWVLSVYKYTEQFPRHELFGLTSQLRRAAVSVPANFAEGFRRRGRRDKIRFYNISQGSLEECRYYLILSRDLGYGEPSDLTQIVDDIARMLDAYMRSLTFGDPQPSPSSGPPIDGDLSTDY